MASLKYRDFRVLKKNPESFLNNLLNSKRRSLFVVGKRIYRILLLTSLTMLISRSDGEERFRKQSVRFG